VLAAGTASPAFAFPVETIGCGWRHPSGLPQQLSWLDLVPGLLPRSLTITMLGAIESLMSAVVADRMSGAGTTRTWSRSPSIANVASLMLAAFRPPGFAHRDQHPNRAKTRFPDDPRRRLAIPSRRCSQPHPMPILAGS
jgi:SulP family sulfate permease